MFSPQSKVDFEFYDKVLTGPQRKISDGLKLVWAGVDKALNEKYGGNIANIKDKNLRQDCVSLKERTAGILSKMMLSSNYEPDSATELASIRNSTLNLLEKMYSREESKQ